VSNDLEVVRISPWGILIGLLIGVVVYLATGGLILALIVGIIVALVASMSWGYYGGRRGPP
jgi:hypothetical protein